jgi:hypothetical protein
MYGADQFSSLTFRTARRKGALTFDIHPPRVGTAKLAAEYTENDRGMRMTLLYLRKTALPRDRQTGSLDEFLAVRLSNSPALVGAAQQSMATLAQNANTPASVAAKSALAAPPASSAATASVDPKAQSRSRPEGYYSGSHALQSNRRLRPRDRPARTLLEQGAPRGQARRQGIRCTGAKSTRLACQVTFVEHRHRSHSSSTDNTFWETTCLTTLFDRHITAQAQERYFLNDNFVAMNEEALE